ncbi:hypothetical protein VE04_07490 [Pseudogymnoascus sp. 24MN13]|nr:hypothetical protein VE04_07490 [Pseudogymnoascus sp. 24MN13]
MADDFNFLNFIEDGSEPAPKDTPKETQDSDSDAENAERKDFWDHVPTDNGGAEGSPNSSFNSSPTLPTQHDFPAPDAGHAKQGTRKPVLQRLRDARTYGFRKNVERRVFKGSGAMDHDESGNYDPNEEATANRRLAKKKAATKSGPAEVETTQYDSQGEEILPSIEEGVSAEESSVEQKHGKGSKKKTTAAAGQKKGKGKGKAKESETTNEACSACRIFGFDCSILDDPDQFPCTSCSELSIACVLKNPKTPEAKAERKRAFANAKKKKKEQARLQKEQKKNKGKNLVQLAAQRAAPKIDPRNRKYISCARCRAADFGHCSLKTREQTGPCKRCTAKKVDCTFEDKVVKLGKAGAKNGKVGKAAIRASSKGRASLLMASAARARPAPKKKERVPEGMFKKTIKTSFCHPITFNLDLQRTRFMGMNCHFHTTTAFPMLGIGEPQDVEVLGPTKPCPANPFVYTECAPRIVLVKKKKIGEREDRSEDEEADNDDEATEDEDDEEGYEYVEEEEDPTYVCTDCTFARQRILFCDTHSISAIAGLKHPRDYDYNSAYEKIMRDQNKGYGANSARVVKWCSVCVAPAFYKCCVPDRFVGEVGCGLLLCEVCAQGLCGGEAKLEGLLDEMVEEQARDPFMPIQKRRSVVQQVSLDLLIDRAGRDAFRYEDGIRADAGFLTNRGELKLWMESQTVADPYEIEEPEVRMNEATGAGAARGAGRAGWGEGMGVNGGREETFEEYDLRMKLEKGKAEQANPAFTSVAPSVSADTDDWAL